MKIGKRNLGVFAATILDPSNYSAIPRFIETYDNPIKAMFDEFFSTGTYPCFIKIKTPIGKQKVKLFSLSDFSTLNLVFCRRDYYVPKKNMSTVIDIGSNIGLSSLYWLTRNDNCFTYCYEPSPISFERLTENLSNFSHRYSVSKAAVSDFNGKAKFYLEESGVNSSLNPNGLNKSTDNFIECEVIHINDLLEQVISKYNHIDVLKIDNEGHELRTIKAIDKSFYQYISVINVEKCEDGASQYIPQEFNYSTVASSERFVRVD